MAEIHDDSFKNFFYLIMQTKEGEIRESENDSYCFYKCQGYFNSENGVLTIDRQIKNKIIEKLEKDENIIISFHFNPGQDNKMNDFYSYLKKGIQLKDTGGDIIENKNGKIKYAYHSSRSPYNYENIYKSNNKLSDDDLNQLFRELYNIAVEGVKKCGLNDLKMKLINYFLPLDIDIQGYYEAKKGKKPSLENYRQEISDDYEKDFLKNYEKILNNNAEGTKNEESHNDTTTEKAEKTSNKIEIPEEIENHLKKIGGIKIKDLLDESINEGETPYFHKWFCELLNMFENM